MIGLKRAYDAAEREDGRRFLVERLWPRGMRKHALQLEAWLKDVAPSTELRRWFGHDLEKWEEFQRRYRRELDAKRGTWAPLLTAARHGRVTLVYSSRDREHNNAVVLQRYLQAKLASGRLKRAA